MAMLHPSPDQEPSVAVLASGGLDSAILCIDLLERFTVVHPLYVRFGLRWEDVELAGLKQFLDAVPRVGLKPLTVLDEPMANVYGGTHWSTGGPGVPGARTEDDAVYLPGRNLLLAAKALVWCRLRNIDALAFGCLRGNPFPDSMPEFFRSLEDAAALALGGRTQLLRPFERLGKDEVMQRGSGLPLHATFSCLNPVAGGHCGDCNKCAERRRGFRSLGWTDPTPYVTDPPP
jgi:7-cyano-7-deazaguanine synthase